MTTHLPERLRDLADEAPRALSADGLWRDGRRRHRRRMTTVAVVVGTVVALSAGVGYGDHRSRQPEPVTPPVNGARPMAIPDPLFNPSPWLPGTRKPGRLVAVFSSTRGRFPFGSERNAIVGVAAGSQTYRFLDLPGTAPEDPDAYLSPDGKHIAYWVSRRQGDPSVVPDSVVGVAVLDLTTGAVERHAVDVRYGLTPQSLSWADSKTVVMVAGHFTSSGRTSYSGRTRTYLAAVGDPTTHSTPGRGNVLDIPVTSTGGVAAGMVGHRRLRSYDAGSLQPRPDVILSTPVKSLAYEPSHGLVAGTAGNIDASGPTSGQLVVGRVVEGRVHLSQVPDGRRYDQVVTWVDRTHLAPVRHTRDGLAYDVVDVRTGDRRQLTSKPWYAFEVARDALRLATTVPGVAPPSPWNPRWVALGVLVLVGAGGTVLLLGRSRGRL